MSGRALVAVVAIMAFLASLTTGAVMLVRAAASEWQADVAREVTIQVRPVSGRDLEADIAKAAALARASAGVCRGAAHSKEETTRLLEPWLGSGVQLEELPVPRIIVVRIASGAAVDVGHLRRTLGEQIPSASLDDHRGFAQQMTAISLGMPSVPTKLADRRVSRQDPGRVGGGRRRRPGLGAVDDDDAYVGHRRHAAADRRADRVRLPDRARGLPHAGRRRRARRPSPGSRRSR